MRSIFCAAIVAALGLSAAGSAHADVKVPNVIGSHMVLQRDRPLPIWGWAEPGEEVIVTLDAQKVSTKADDKGNWKVTLKAVKSDGKAHTMTIEGKNKIDSLFRRVETYVIEADELMRAGFSAEMFRNVNTPEELAVAKSLRLESS